MAEEFAEPNLLESLICAAEKAANIARLCRSNEQLLSLLIQEKTGTEANARFEHDFKTLADVLIQETIKHDIGALFPAMQNAIRGEESPVFTNAQGDTVTLTVTATEAETAQLLEKVLHKHKTAASALAAEVHRNVTLANCELTLAELPALPKNLNYSNLGIWIDPIDATAEYIRGDSVFTNFPGITSSGLDCVTVLIGVYERSSGIPIIGVVLQPFKNKITQNVYNSEIYWGVALPTLTANNCCSLNKTEEKIRNLRGIFSSSEQADVLQLMQNLGYEFVFSAGAGHKALKVITDEADIYLLTKASTFKWDTCAPQAILRSCGGDILDFKQSIKKLTPISLSYTEDASTGEDNCKCNSGGIIATRQMQLIEDILKKFAEKN